MESGVVSSGLGPGGFRHLTFCSGGVFESAREGGAGVGHQSLTSVQASSVAILRTEPNQGSWLDSHEVAINRELGGDRRGSLRCCSCSCLW